MTTNASTPTTAKKTLTPTGVLLPVFPSTPRLSCCLRSPYAVSPHGLYTPSVVMPSKSTIARAGVRTSSIFKGVKSAVNNCVAVRDPTKSVTRLVARAASRTGRVALVQNWSRTQVNLGQIEGCGAVRAMHSTGLMVCPSGS